MTPTNSTLPRVLDLAPHHPTEWVLGLGAFSNVREFVTLGDHNASMRMKLQYGTIEVQRCCALLANPRGLSGYSTSTQATFSLKNFLWVNYDHVNFV